MHMYRVIQTSPMGGEHVIALHATLEEASDHAERCNASHAERCNATAEEPTFTYFTDADPVEVTVTSID